MQECLRCPGMSLNAKPLSATDIPSFLRRGPSEDGSEREATISNQMMAQYLLALLGDRDPLATMLGDAAAGGGTPDGGRMGDYVFTQEGDAEREMPP